MACRSVPVTALVFFIVFCGTPAPCSSDWLGTAWDTIKNYLIDAAGLGGYKCYLDVLWCLADGVFNPSEPREAIDFRAGIEKVCSGSFKTCTRDLPLDSCNEESRTDIFTLDTALQNTSYALCPAVRFTETCFTWNKFRSCLDEMNTASKLNSWMRNFRQEHLFAIYANISTCVRRNRKYTVECKSADFWQVNKVLDSFFSQPATGSGAECKTADFEPVNKVLDVSFGQPATGSGVTAPASILTALVSVVLSLALSQ